MKATRLGSLYDVRDVRVGNQVEFPLLSVSQIYGVVPRSDLMKDEGRATDLTKYKVCSPGDVVINRMSAYNGAIGVAMQTGIVSPDYLVVTPRPDADSRFISYWLKSHRGQYEVVRRLRGIGSPGTALVRTPRVNESDLRRIPGPFPYAEEQRAIADYLDRETEKIDELITEQRGLIETLRERRQAVIDAEIEKLPESRIALRRYISFLTSGSRGWGDYYADSGDTFVRIGNLSRGGLTLGGERKFVALPPEVTEGQRTVLKTGDLLFSITAYIGSVAVVSEDWAGAYVSQHVALCRLDDTVLNSEFIGYFALSGDGNHQLAEGAVGGTKVQLALDDIKSLRVPLVPLEVQGQIVSCLDDQISRIDELISESEDLIALSQERRAALITAAVTGQIDVRTAA